MSWNLSVSGHVHGSRAQTEATEKLIAAELDSFVAKLHHLHSGVSGGSFNGSTHAATVEAPPAPPPPAQG